MGKTVKTGTTARFGGRYGVGIRKRVLAVELKMNRSSLCPVCGFEATRRLAAGLFECRKCGAEFTGGAYESQTLIGKTINKMVSQKQFVSGLAELVKEKESSFSDIEREVERSLVEDEPKEEKKEKKRRGKKKQAEGSEEDLDEVDSHREAFVGSSVDADDAEE